MLRSTQASRRPRAALCAILALSTAGCAARLPDVPARASLDSVKDEAVDRFVKDNDHLPVQHVHLRSGALSVIRVNKPVSAAMRAKPANFVLGGDEPKLGDLVSAMGLAGFQVSVPAKKAPSGNFTPVKGHSDESPSKATSGLKGLLEGKERDGGGAKPAPKSGGGLADLKSSAGGKADDKGVYDRRLPFNRFKGTLGAMLDSLKTSGDLVSWEQDGTIYLSDTDRFSVTVPQNEDVINNLAQTIHDLGGTEIVTSVDAGKIFYSAPASMQNDEIGPYLRKALRNVATVNIQVAIVSLAINDQSGNGFDWSALSAQLGQNGLLGNAGSGLGTGYGTGYGTNYAGAGTGVLGTNALAASTGTVGTVANGVTTATNGLASTANGLTNAGSGIVSASTGTTGDAFNSSIIGSGKIMGVKMIGSVSTAINYLSTFGSTNIKQNIDLRTVAGKKVELKNEDEIPYVKSIGTNVASGGGYGGGYGGGLGYGGSSLGTAQTDTIKTGLNVSMLPQFDSDNDLVIVDMRLEMAHLVEMVQLNAGNQLGQLSQPHTSKQEVSDLLRIRAGQTAVVGGLQVDSDERHGNEPTALRELGATDTSFGSRTQNVQRTALFIILRPTVVVYDTEGERR